MAIDPFARISYSRCPMIPELEQKLGPVRRLSFAWLVLVLFPMLSSVPASGADQAYVIGASDVLEIQVWDNKDLNQAVFVRPDGKISLPLIGEIEAGGRTVQQLQDSLTE